MLTDDLCCGAANDMVTGVDAAADEEGNFALEEACI